MIEIKFNESKDFHGAQIHPEATHAVKGRHIGTYFKLNGEWCFTVFTGYALRAEVAEKDFNIYDHIKDGAKIEELK